MTVPNPATTPWVPVGPTVIPPVYPKITTSAWSGGPPAGPVNGDIWHATGIASSSGSIALRWTFCWDAANARWAFIGGAPWYGSAVTQALAADNVWSPVPNPVFTSPRAGQYHCTLNYWVTGGSGHGVWACFWAGGGNVGNGMQLILGADNGTAAIGSNVSSVGVAAGGTIQPAGYVTDHTADKFQTALLTVTPIYIT